MTLIRTLTISTTTFKRMKEKFYGFLQTEYDNKAVKREYTLKLNNYAKPGSHFSKYREFLPMFFLETKLSCFQWLDKLSFCH